jgi:hypothetical protein
MASRALMVAQRAEALVQTEAHHDASENMTDSLRDGIDWFKSIARRRGDIVGCIPGLRPQRTPPGGEGNFRVRARACAAACTLGGCALQLRARLSHVRLG